MSTVLQPRFIAKELKGIGANAYSVDLQTGKTHNDAHWHNCCEIVYVNKGKVSFFFNNQWCELTEGTMFFVPPGRIHCFNSPLNETVKIVLGFSNELITVDCTEINFPVDVLYGLKFCQFNISEDSKISELFFKLVDAQKMSEPISTLLCKAYILEIYSYIWRTWESEGITQNLLANNDIINKLIKTVNENPSEAPGAYQMAKTLNISYSYMSAVLKNIFNMSYVEILNIARIDMSKKLLLASQKSIAEIGYECGFCDSSYFIKLFKKNTGITPKQYRKTYS